MANMTWSEPEPPSEEKTERAFAPLIDPQQKSALIKAVKQHAPRDPVGDKAGQPRPPDGEAPEPEPDADTPTGEPATEVADVPTERPTLEK